MAKYFIYCIRVDGLVRHVGYSVCGRTRATTYFNRFLKKRGLKLDITKWTKLLEVETTEGLYAEYLRKVYEYRANLWDQDGVIKKAIKVWGLVSKTKRKGNPASLKPNDSFGIRDIKVKEEFSWGA